MSQKGPGIRVGIGVDAHRFSKERPLILGGVEVPHYQGLVGHSDADVLTHTIMDALLGALNLGSIGHLFPDTDEAYKDANSMELLARVCALISEKGYIIGNVDAVIVAQAPRLNPYLEEIKHSLASVMDVTISDVSVKATTTEKMGPEGREEGISSQAVVLLYSASPN